MKQTIFEQIKNSKKYKDLADEIIRKEIREYLKSNPDYKRYKEKKVVKDIKSRLHKIYGSFQIKKKKKREDYLEKKKYEEILKTNVSTKERIPEYEKLYDSIFTYTGKPKIILDLGSGINPVSVVYMKTKPKYYVYDINEADMKFLNKFFKKAKIKGKAQTLDLSKLENIKKLPRADVCLMFKVIDPLERGKGHKLSEQIIKALKCRYIVASFATRTLSGKRMTYPYRGWIEVMLNRIGLSFNKLQTKNEVFYIIKK